MNHYTVEDKLVVFVDVLRNTSTMTAALFHGMDKVKPVASVEETLSYNGKEGYITAGERHGIKIPEVDKGNSPLAFVDQDNKGKTLVITSTNGTQSVHAASNAAILTCGSFVNETVLKDFILEKNMPTLLLASGWRNNMSLEDTLFVGRLVELLKNDFEQEGDPLIMAHAIYKQAEQVGMKEFVMQGSHYVRIRATNDNDDIDYCFTTDIAPVVPVYDGEFLRV